MPKTNKVPRNIFRLIDSVKENSKPEVTFLNDLEATIEITNSSNSRKPSRSYKPSSMNCIRNMYFQVTGEVPDSERNNSCNIGICESGTDRHERLQAAIISMKSIGMDCEYIDVESFIKSRKIKGLSVVSKTGFETKLYHKALNISFMCDGIIKYKGIYYIFEAKTETSQKHMKRTGVDPGHYTQATIYSMAFGINDVMFLYENRDNCSKKVYILNVTDEMRFNELTKIETCEKHRKDKKVPNIPNEAGDGLCRYCRYKTACGSCL